MVYPTALPVYDMRMQPLIVEYLRCHSFQQLEDDHGVVARFSKDGTKASLNYDQILAKNGDPVAEQCRGMIIRPTQFDKYVFGDSWKSAVVGRVEVLAWPMCRFYNFGDPAASEIDWADSGLKVYEKVDGTCIILYWDSLQARWHAATRSVCEADLPISANDMAIGDTTFSQLFLQALTKTREELSGKPVDWVIDGPDKVIHLNKELTYVFELVSLHNQIVVVYPEPRVYLLAARHTASGQELDIDTLRIEHVRRPKTWEIRDVATLSAFVDSADPSQLEGAVVRDSLFNRIKVKNKTYVLAHRAKDTVTSSVRNALETVIRDKADDVIPLVPNDVADRLRKMQVAFGDYCRAIDARVARFRAEASGNRKRFAEQVNLSGDWGAPYFNLYENRAANAREWFMVMCEKGKLSASSLDTILTKLDL